MIDKLPYGFINSVYGFNDYTLNELICKIAQKMDEVITQANDSFNYLDWLKGQGLSDEVINTLLAWKEDGTLNTIINENIFNGLNNKINEIGTQLGNIATVGDVNKINMLIALGVKRFKLPSGRIKVDNTIELIGDVEIYGNKDTILYTEKDISILSTKKDEQIHSNIYIHDLQISQEYQGLARNLPIDLENANMCRIERILCNSTNTNINTKEH